MSHRCKQQRLIAGNRTPTRSSRIHYYCRPKDAQRSRLMAAIRGSNNKTTEYALATVLRKNRIWGWRRRLDLPGHPDFTFAKLRTVVFVDGCFWHGCPACYKPPRHNARYWAQKILRNRTRDKHVTRALRKLEWSVVRIWEHEMLSPERPLNRLRAALQVENAVGSN